MPFRKGRRKETIQIYYFTRTSALQGAYGQHLILCPMILKRWTVFLLQLRKQAFWKLESHASGHMANQRKNWFASWEYEYRDVQFGGKTEYLDTLIPFGAY